jgi:predicted O-linked N-acetylglucosamine transferase (SPINDLY family)
MPEAQNLIHDTIEQSLMSAENLISNNELNSALSILKDLETASLSFIESSKHHNLILTILEKYKKINELENTSPLSKELAFLYLGFEKYYEANNIFENLLKTSNDDPLLLYGQLKCLSKLQLDISCLEQSFHNFLGQTDLSSKELEFACKEIGTFYLNLKNNEELGIKFYKKAFELNPSCPELNLFFLALHHNNKNYNPDILNYIPYALENTHLGSLPNYIAITLAMELGSQELSKQLITDFTKKFPEDEWSYFYHSLKKYAYGLIDENLALLKQSLDKNPQNHSAHDNRVMTSHYSPTITQQEILTIANEYHQNIIKPVIKASEKKFEFSKHVDQYRKEKIIRIGFVSGDFKLHPIFFWVNSLLKYFPKDGFEIYCYVNNAANTFSEVFRPLCNSLAYVTDLSSEKLAERIFNDKIHVLIDLSGHTAANQLKTFALKPAPIQATWLGQVGTTGLKEIDYIIADEFVIRKDEEHFYTEKICHMPFAMAYPAKDYQNLYINRSLARNDGKIILGSFNNSPKINSTVIEAWAEILKSAPEAQILMSNFTLADPEYKTELINNFKKFEINESRLEFELPETKASHLLRFSKIDIALDTFPFNGGTTTHETLMMSVPLIAIEGDRWASRMSADALINAKLPELIAKDRQEYISKIVNLAKSPEQIVYYKQTIREKYLNSPAADIESFSKDFTAKIKDFWDQYLTSKNP